MTKMKTLTKDQSSRCLARNDVDKAILEASVKLVEYAYPTSDNATRFGFNDGCYTVEVWNRTTLLPTALSGHKTRDQAIEYAKLIALPWAESFLKNNPDLQPKEAA